MRKKERILVVDDEPDIVNLLEYTLERAGYEVSVASDGPEALGLARTVRPDLIVLDIMLPEMEGTEVLKRLKAGRETGGIPAIMLTAKGEEVDRILGLELGAEDYITKPFSPRELVLRVRAVLKRASGRRESTGILRAGAVTIDLERHSASVGGDPVELSAREFSLLAELAAAGGRVLSRDSLLDSVWGTECYVLPRTVDTHIRRLRSKLGPAADVIETVRGVGYRISAPAPSG